MGIKRILVDGKILNEVILPTLNVSRRCADGKIDPNDIMNKSQVFITTSGWKSSFAYEKVLQILIWQIIKPGKAICLGGTWRTPVMCGLLDKSFLRDIREDETFSEESFDREYESGWSGASLDAFFDGEAIERNRTLTDAEEHAVSSPKKLAYYVISVDVARIGCQTVATVFKVEPQTYGGSIKKLVNIFVYEAEHFAIQALELKKLYYRYNAEKLVIDLNGLGVGLMDSMVLPSLDPVSEETLPGFLLENDETGLYKKYENQENVERNAIFGIKANAQINTVMHSNCAVQMRSDRVKFLIDERTKKSDLLSSVKGQGLSSRERAEVLRPYILTGILKEEILNLREKNSGANIMLERVSAKMQKDKFSAFEMGLYYIKIKEDTGKRKRTFKASELMLIN